MNKKRIIFITAPLLLILIGYIIIFRGNSEGDNSVEVKRGDITREIFKAGTIEKGDEIRLSFGIPGTIERIFFKEGDNIKAGETMAILDNKSLLMELDQAELALKAAKIEFEKLSVTGSSMELQSARIMVTNAEDSLLSATKKLEKAKEADEVRMNNTYKTVAPSLSKAVLVANSAYETAKSVSKIHFSNFYTNDTRIALNARDRIEWALDKILHDQRAITDPGDREMTDIALSTTDLKIKAIFEDLDLIRKVLDKDPYREVSGREVNLLTAEMTAVNLFSSSIGSLIGSINASKSMGEAEIVSAEAGMRSAKGALRQAEDQLSRIESPARREHIELARIKVSQTETNVNLVKKKIQESTIVAPFDGRILKIDARSDEFVQVGFPIISIVPDHPYQTEVYIYEGDIAGIKIGDPVDIEIVAFPNRIFKGKIIFIDRRSEIVDGVVNYRVLTSIEDYPEEIMLGMTVDVTIVPEKRLNVLYLPDSAVKLGTVLLIVNGETVERPVETGLMGFDRNIEIISGLEEGDRVIISR